MGAEIIYYIQQRKQNDEGWEDVALYTKDNKRAEIYRCGRDTWDLMKETWGCNMISYKDIKELGKEVGWIIDEDEKIPYLCISLAYLEHHRYMDKFNEYDTEIEAIDYRAFYKNLYDEIKQYINFADVYYGSPDDIRIIAFLSDQKGELYGFRILVIYE